MDLCNPFYVEFDGVPMDVKFYEKTKEVMDILVSSNKHALLTFGLKKPKIR